jgi:hypothetical protein
VPLVTLKALGLDGFAAFEHRVSLDKLQPRK